MTPQQIEQAIARAREARSRLDAEIDALLVALGCEGDETPGALGRDELIDYDAKTLIEWSKR